jgi:hypothetical protein
VADIKSAITVGNTPRLIEPIISHSVIKLNSIDRQIYFSSFCKCISVLSHVLLKMITYVLRCGYFCTFIWLMSISLESHKRYNFVQMADMAREKERLNVLLSKYDIACNWDWISKFTSLSHLFLIKFYWCNWLVWSRSWRLESIYCSLGWCWRYSGM